MEKLPKLCSRGNNKLAQSSTSNSSSIQNTSFQNNPTDILKQWYYSGTSYCVHSLLDKLLGFTKKCMRLGLH